jgi:hypothetical protein
VNTCNEKWMVANKVAQQLGNIHPRSPAVRLFDAGLGDGTVLTRVMRGMHHRYPNMPFHISGKEISLQDALACFDIAREEIRILSLGTGESTFTVNEKARMGGIKHWAFLRSFNAAARAQSRNALGQAYLLVGKNNVTRIDVPESDAPIALDDVPRSVRELPMVARSLVEEAGHHIERVFLDGAVERFVRCPMA